MWQEGQAATPDPTVPAGCGLTVTQAERRGAREPEETSRERGHLRGRL